MMIADPNCIDSHPQPTSRRAALQRARALESCAATRLMLEYGLRQAGIAEVEVCATFAEWMAGLDAVDLATIDLDSTEVPDGAIARVRGCIVGVTSDCSWAAINRAISLGASDIVLRPLSEPDLIQLIERATALAAADGEPQTERRLLRRVTELLAERNRRLREFAHERQTVEPTPQQQQRRRESERQLRLLERAKREWESSVDSLDELIAITDDRGTIVRINRAAERWGFGAVQELVGQNLAAYLPDELCRRIGWTEPGAGVKIDAAGGEWQLQDAAGRYLDARMLPVRSSPSPQRRWILILADQTARRTAEERLRQSEERLREARKMESIGRIAGGVAHDFNNILTAIKGHAQLLELELPEDSAFAEDVREILTACNRAEHLTRQLLVFSRRQVLNLCAVDLNDLVRGLGRSLHAMLPPSVRLEIEPCDEALIVDADPSLIERIVNNLVQNASDAIDGSGRICLRTGSVEVRPDETETLDVPEPGAYATIEVEDDGAGIPPEDLPQIFEPFFTTKPRGRGTGLGLATVYGSVKQMRGTVTVSSQPGAGTTMRILLPQATQLEGAPEATGPALAETPVRRPSVLLVEDDPQVREITRRALAGAGLSVIVADGPREAELCWATHQDYVSAVVTDIVMPGKTGLELVEQFTEQRPDLPVLFVSGYTDQAVHTLGALPPTQRFLAKPFTPSALLQALRELADLPVDGRNGLR